MIIITRIIDTYDTEDGTTKIYYSGWEGEFVGGFSDAHIDIKLTNHQNDDWTINLINVIFQTSENLRDLIESLGFAIIK